MYIFAVYIFYIDKLFTIIIHIKSVGLKKKEKKERKWKQGFFKEYTHYFFTSYSAKINLYDNVFWIFFAARPTYLNLNVNLNSIRLQSGLKCMFMTLVCFFFSILWFFLFLFTVDSLLVLCMLLSGLEHAIFTHLLVENCVIFSFFLLS